MARASERVVILMTPAEKRAMEIKARKMGASAGDLVRRSVKAYAPELDESLVEAALNALTAAHKRSLTALDRAERELAATRAHFAKGPKERAP